MASLRKYTCTCEVTLTPGLFLVNICNICIKIHQKCTKNLVLEPLWGALGSILGFRGNQDAPKRRPRAPKRRQDRNFGGNLTQLGSNSIDSPQGGATAASPFVCRNVGGPPCLVGLHVQDCIAEGTWGNDIFNFGYDLVSIFARAT